MPSDDIGVVSGEIEGVYEEHCDQQDTHEDMWDTGTGDGGVQQVCREVGSRERTTVTLCVRACVCMCLILKTR